MNWFKLHRHILMAIEEIGATEETTRWFFEWFGGVSADAGIFTQEIVPTLSGKPLFARQWRMIGQLLVSS